jgi:hypothetical protein
MGKALFVLFFYEKNRKQWVPAARTEAPPAASIQLGNLHLPNRIFMALLTPARTVRMLCPMDSNDRLIGVRAVSRLSAICRHK